MNPKDFTTSNSDREGFNQMIDWMVDLLAKTGDAKMIMLKQEHILSEKITNLSIALGDKLPELDDEVFEELTSMYKQFGELIDDFAKEHHIT